MDFSRSVTLQKFTLFAACLFLDFSPVQAERPKLATPQAPLSQDALQDANIRAQWPDSPLDIYCGCSGLLFHRRLTCTFTAAGGDDLGSILTTSGDFNDPLRYGFSRQAAPILDPASGEAITTTKYTYAGSGSIYRAQHNLWLQLYHAEHSLPNTTIGIFYSVIGVAISHNCGRTWIDAGEIITPSLSYADWIDTSSCNPQTFEEVEIGAGAFAIVRDRGRDYFYTYFHDVFAPWPYQDGGFQTSVARAPVSEVLDAARRDKTTTWTKYYNGEWSHKLLEDVLVPWRRVINLATAGFQFIMMQERDSIFLPSQPAMVRLLESTLRDPTMA